MGRNRGLPHYRRLMDSLLAAPVRDKAPVRLPSERALARRFNVARNTARRALDELRAQGYATRLQGSGTYRQPKSARLIFAFGYLLGEPHFSSLFQWFGHFMAEKEFRLVIRETGLRGEHLAETFRPEEVSQAEALLWIAPSHPEGLKLCRRARRKLPQRLPGVFVNDTLGLSLQGGGRIDLVHFDFEQAAEQLVTRLLSRRHHPVLVNRTDVSLFSSAQAETGFVGALVKAGVADPSAHILTWNPQDPATLHRFLRDRRRSRAPDVFVLHYPHEPEFRDACAFAGTPLAPGAMLVPFGQNHSPYRIPMNFRAMAEICADLLTSRLKAPGRPNLHVALSLPVRNG